MNIFLFKFVQLAGAERKGGAGRSRAVREALETKAVA